MENSPVSIKQAQLSDLAFFLDLARKEGWNPGTDDAKPFYLADPNGFFIAEVGGKKVGCISAVTYEKAFGFMGFYIVLPEHRGKGYGLELWQAALNHLKGQPIGLDGVVAQQDNYKKSGFSLYYKNTRFEGALKGTKCDSALPLNQIPFEKLLSYDTKVFGCERRDFLRQWILMPNATALGITDQNDIRGYGVIRKCNAGYKIGPLFADDADTAEKLLLALALTSKEAPLYIDIPEVNTAALPLIKKYNLHPVFETARMYLGSPPKQLLSHVFGITSFELG